ncbi:MAG: rhodanese-related sulfurtransferase [Simkaniaceae bacterium]|nr:rhodanese-related sulfurtransferase [Simkaniaceae bacterium]
MEYEVLAYYYFGTIEDPDLEVKNHKEFFKTQDVKGRIYISNKGINGQMSASPESSNAYQAWLHTRYPEIEFKIHHHTEHAFAKMTVKHRTLVAMGEEAEAQDGGDHVSPEQWAQMIENKDDDTIIVDVRNRYEWEVGHFEGAELPDLDTFREFPEYARNLKSERDPSKTKVMMYCTGGIRCELYSALMKKEGFENVFQLQGGVIKYGQKQGAKHWRGKLFVFDDRLVTPISEDNTETISHCHFCDTPTDTYYNCANMDCNELFLACKQCVSTHKGCCQSSCESAPNVRPFQETDNPKPFRKLRK